VRFGDDADGDAGRADADLTAREIDLQIGGHLPGPPEAGGLEGRLVVLSDPCECELGGDEHRVRADQQQPSDQSEADFETVHTRWFHATRKTPVGPTTGRRNG